MSLVGVPARRCRARARPHMSFVMNYYYAAGDDDFIAEHKGEEKMKLTANAGWMKMVMGVCIYIYIYINISI